MKLISEYADPSLLEYTTAGKTCVIEGVFAQAEKKNRNGRVYPKAIMERAVDKYVSEQVSNDRAVGELNHPSGPTVNLDRVSHKITSLEFKGNDVIGKATVLNTPMGKVVRELIEGKVKIGVSTRGMGSLSRRGDDMVVGNDYILNTVDIVQDPSAPGAFVNGIMEGVEFSVQNGCLVRRRMGNAMGEVIAEFSDPPIKNLKDFLNSL